MIILMNEKWIEVEGADLAQALEKACAELGLTREDLDYDFDLDHFKGGASTVRILAGKRDRHAAELSGEIADRVKRLLEGRNLDASVSSRVSLFAVQIELRAPASGISDEPFRAFTATLEKDLAEYTDGRELRVSLRGFGTEDRFESSHRKQRDRSDDRGRRPRDSWPEDDADRDEKLRQKARIAVEKVMVGNGPVSLQDLNSYERRLVHMVVREFDGVVSRSVGEGTHKDVLIDRGNPDD